MREGKEEEEEREFLFSSSILVCLCWFRVGGSRFRGSGISSQIRFWFKVWVQGLGFGMLSQIRGWVCVYAYSRMVCVYMPDMRPNLT